MKTPPAGASVDYTMIQCMGMSICTTPGSLTPIEEMSDEGKYLGYEDIKTDIDARLNLLHDAIVKAKASLGEKDPASTLKIFVVPEFYFRGNKGAYLCDNTGPAGIFTKYFQPFLNFVRCKKGTKDHPYQDWLFVLGTLLTAKTKATPDTGTKSLYYTGDHLLDVYHKLHPDPPKATMGAYGKSPLRAMLKRLDEEESCECSLKSLGAAAASDMEFQSVLRRTLDYCDGKADITVANHCYIVPGGDQSILNSDFLRVLKKHKSKEDFILNSITNNYTQTITKYESITSDDEVKKTAMDPYSIFKVRNVRIGVELCLDHSRKRLFNHLQAHDKDYVDLHLVPSCGMSVRPGAVIAATGGHVFNCDGEYTINGGAINGEHSHTTLQQVQKCIDPKGENPEAKLYPAERCKVMELKCSTDLYPYADYHLHIYNPVDVRRAASEEEPVL